MALVLLAEDEEGMRTTLGRALRREGHEVDEHADGESAARAGAAGAHDLVLLDVEMPGLDGLEVCRRVRAARPDVRIVMLTGRGGELDAVTGLDAGADDYVTKPFRLAELLARVRAHTRQAGARDALAAGPLRMDLEARRAWIEDDELKLSPKEFDVLAVLAAAPGRAVPREEIMQGVWGGPWYGSAKTLDMHVMALRRKIGDRRPDIVTVRGIGMRLDP